MGCFSFLSIVSDNPINSDSSDGDAVYLFLLQDGIVIEEMFGNYDSYGRVFADAEHSESFEWGIVWNDVCQLIFNGNSNSGIAAMFTHEYKNVLPLNSSDGDPEQGWGKDKFDFVKVQHPYHKVYTQAERDEQAKKSQLDKLADWQKAYGNLKGAFISNPEKPDIGKKLTVLSTDNKSNWQEHTLYQQKNRVWLNKAVDIALEMFAHMSRNNLTKQAVSDMTGIPLDEIKLILKGQANSTLETISRIEEAFGIKLLTVVNNPDPDDV